MKIIAVDNNYDAARCTDRGPAWYLLTHSCLQRDNKPVYLPDRDDDFRLFPSMAIRIDRLGKSIAERFAHRYWDHLSFGFSLRGMDTYRRLVAEGLPTGEATSFDSSVIIAPQWIAAERAGLHDLGYSISDGEKELSRWAYSSLVLGADALLARLSTKMTFKTGDILYLGFPSEGIRLDREMKIIVNEESQSASGTIYNEFCSFKVRPYPTKRKTQ